MSTWYLDSKDVALVDDHTRRNTYDPPRFFDMITLVRIKFFRLYAYFITKLNQKQGYHHFTAIKLSFSLLFAANFWISLSLVSSCS